MERTTGEKAAERSPQTEMPQVSFYYVVPVFYVEKGQRPVMIEI